MIVWIFFTLVYLLQSIRADADFIDVRVNLNFDRSGKKGDPAEKYFHESVFDPHHDGRFAQQKVPPGEKLIALTAMMQTFLSTMSDIGAETWIMHGTLLGWYWNQKILPWDSDLDVQVSEPTIAFLAKYYNMTEYRYYFPKQDKRRNYLLEINPRYIYRDQADYLNVIDGRWIDTDTGLFIDISTVRPDYYRRGEGVQGALMVKDRHHYLERDIFPLRDSYFEGVHVKIPFEYEMLLVEEYGEAALTQTIFANHQFNDTTKVWEPLPWQMRPGVRPGVRAGVRPFPRPPS